MRTITRFVAGVVLAALAVVASAQGYPNKTIRMVVPFTAGGPTDVIARTVAQKLTESFGQQVEIVSKLNSAIVQALQMPDVKERLNSQGFEIRTSTPEQVAAYIKSETVKWTKIVKDSGATVD